MKANFIYIFEQLMYCTLPDGFVTFGCGWYNLLSAGHTGTYVYSHPKFILEHKLAFKKQNI